MTRDTQKIKKLGLRKLFRPSPSKGKKEVAKANLLLLQKLATTKEQKDILQRIEDETIPTVRDAWIEYFFKITKQSQGKGN